MPVFDTLRELRNIKTYSTTANFGMSDGNRTKLNAFRGVHENNTDTESGTRILSQKRNQCADQELHHSLN